MRFQNVQSSRQSQSFLSWLFLNTLPPGPERRDEKSILRNYRCCPAFCSHSSLLNAYNLYMLFQRGPGGISASGAAMIWLSRLPLEIKRWNDYLGWCASLRSIPIRWVFQQLMEEETLWILKCFFLWKGEKGNLLKNHPIPRGCASPRFQSFLHTKMPWHFSEESGRS